jgi:nicotinamidase-related amidase
VSLNAGIMGLTIEAINHGYHVVVVTDCVAGYPSDYGEEVLANSLAKMSTLASAEELVTLWHSA